MLVIVNNHFNPLFGGIIDGWKFPLRKKLFSLKAKFSLPIGKSVCYFLPCWVNLLKKAESKDSAYLLTNQALLVAKWGESTLSFQRIRCLYAF